MESKQIGKGVTGASGGGSSREEVPFLLNGGATEGIGGRALKI